MKNSLPVIFISLLTGVSCSLSPKEALKKETKNPKEVEIPAEKSAERYDRDKGEVLKKKNFIPKKEIIKTDSHQKPANTLQKKKTPIKNQSFKNPEKESEEKNSQKKNNEELTKIIKVHGMVCAFCSNSIEKKFKQQKAVKSIKVDLKSKKITLVLKAGETFPDREIKKLIKASGFQPVSIENKK